LLSGSSRFYPLSPLRLKRLFSSQIDPPNPSRIEARETRCVEVVASGATAGEFVGVNITPVRASGTGYGTLHSSDVPAGDVSNVNYVVGSVDPNLAFVQVGSDREICFTNGPGATVDLILDVVVRAAADSMASPSPETYGRIVDTRISLGGTRLGASEKRCFPVRSTAARGQYVGVNVTPVRASGPGFGTLHSPANPVGVTSTVNYAPGSVDPNFAFVQVDQSGQICFTNGPGATVDLVLDQLTVASKQWFRDPTAAGPVRLVDTRAGLGGVRLTGSETRCVDAVGAGVGEYVGVNVTVVGVSAPGFGTLHSSDQVAGDTSTVNYAPGSIDPNNAITQVGRDGKICFTNGPDAMAHLILDEVTVMSPEVFEGGGSGVRILDTRRD
jgi:hypothetical protein